MSAQVVVRFTEYPNGEKRCSRCGEMLPIADFHPVRHREGPGRIVERRHSQCRPCHQRTKRDSYMRVGRTEHDRSATGRFAYLRLVSLPSPPPVAERALPDCVCGHVQYFHRRDGKGPCACGTCPSWHERGL